MTTATAGVTHTTQTIDGTNVSVMRGGSGSPLLFLHGADAFTQWLPFMDDLAARFEVIVPDHPGFGRSDSPAWLDEIGDLAAFYRAFIDTLGLRDITLAGHALGGWIAAEVALRNAAGVRSLVLADAAGLPLAEDGLDPFMLSPEALLRASYADAAHIPVPDDDARAQIAKNALMTARMAWQPRYYDPQLAKWLHRLRLPTLVVWGKHDAIFPVRQAAEFAGAIPGAKTTIIDGAGHLPHIETPQAFAAAVIAFAAGIPA